MLRDDVIELGEAAADDAAALLAEAFADYPTTAWFVAPSPLGSREALGALMRFFVTARLLRDEPVLAARVGPTLAAVALVSFPQGGASPPALATARETLWTTVGAAVRSRYEAYGRALQPLLAEAASLHVNLAGVRPTFRGRGCARRLFDRVHALAETMPGDRSVSLTTEDPQNLRLYRHLGYEVAGHAEVAPGITSWMMRRAPSSEFARPGDA